MKAKFSVSYLMEEKIKEDSKSFGLEKGALINRIFASFSVKKIKKLMENIRDYDIDEEGRKYPVQFNLNVRNIEVFGEIFDNIDVKNKSKIYRMLCSIYLNNSKYIREKTIFKDVVTEIDKAIKGNKKLKILYGEKERVVNPYFIKGSSGEDRGYLFCYCEKNNDYRNYRLCHILNIEVIEDEREIKDKEYIEGVKKNFDPFISYGQIVKVRFTDVGKQMYERAVLNRPKLKDKEKDIYIFQATKKLGEIYFPQFVNEVEILEPIELREWMKEKLEKALKVYKEN